ncbi:MAG: phospholipid carrier-dependent glycosyltransferase, partial [Planctomycetota bacterium]
MVRGECERIIDSDIRQTETTADSLLGSTHIDRLFLLLIAVVSAAWGLGAGPMLSDHEAIVAQGARQALQGDGWLVPHVGDAPFIRKPPTPFWLVSLASLLCDAPGDLPVSVYAARLPSAIAGILLTLLVYATGRMMFSHRVGIVAGVVQAVSLGGFYFAHNTQVEMLLTLTCTGAITCFWAATQHRSRSMLLAFYACLGGAMMCKAPLPVAVVVLPLAVWWLLVLPWIDRDSVSPTTGEHGESPPARVSFGRRVLDQIRRIPQLIPIAGIGLFL